MQIKKEYKYYRKGDHFELFNAYRQPLGRFTTEKAVLDFLDLLKEQDRINAIKEVQRERWGR